MATSTRPIGTATKPSLLKKVSVKTAVGNVKRLFPNRYEADAPDGDSWKKGDIIPGQTVQLLRVAGVITSLKRGASAFGEWVAFIGDVRAVNMITGEIFQGKELYAPELITDFIQSAVGDAIENGTPVEVAFDVSATSNKSPMGYQYGAVPLMEMSADESPAQKLLESFGVVEVAQKQLGLSEPDAAQLNLAVPEAENTPPATAQRRPEAVEMGAKKKGK